jgi:hypothetical protein
MTELKTIYFEGEFYAENNQPEPFMEPGIYRVIDGELYMVTDQEIDI